jgi:tetratricopeptide (TPR) repeat protein
MMGTLNQGTVPGLLGQLYAGRFSGDLHFVQGQERRSLSISRGQIVNANTNVESEHLGEILVRQGLLRRADLQTARQIVVEEKKRLGVVLQELGLLDERGLRDALALHVREVLGKVFAWSDGSYALEENAGEARAEEEADLNPLTAEMILEATRRIEDPDVVRYALGDIDQVLVPAMDPLHFQKLTLTSTDGYILSRVDGTLSAREIVQLIPLPPEETQRSLLGLLATGMLQRQPARAKAPARAPAPAAPPAPAPEAPPLVEPGGAADDPWRREILETYESLRTRDYFALLGIPRSATPSEVKEAYFRRARRYHPDVHDPSVADLKDKRAAILIRLGEVYETLRDRHRRAAYESTLGPVARDASPARESASEPPTPAAGPAPPLDPIEEALLAEDALRRAERLLIEAKYWDAIQLLEAALPRIPGPVMRVRSQILLARGYLENPNWVRRGEELLHKVVHENPQNLEAHFMLGVLYEERGLKTRAEAMFRKVLELQPGHREAAAHLEALTPPALLKKLFRR